MTARKKWLLLGAAIVVLLLGAGGAVFALTRPPEDVSNPDVAFEEEPTVTAVPSAIPEEPEEGSKQVDPLKNFVWGEYGYTKDRRRFLPASTLLRPPYWRVWSYTGSILLEFPPVMAEGKLFLLKNNGALHAIDKKTGKRKWARKLGVLAASSPSYGNGRIFVTLLSRGKTKAGAVLALDAENGKILWKRLLPSRSESSPLFDNDRIYLGSENGTVYNLRAGDGAVRWTFKASGAVKGGLALANGKLFFGDYKGRVYAIRQGDGGQVWATGHQGREVRAQLRAVLLDARGRLRARLHRQHRRAHVLVLLGQRQARVDQGHGLLRLRLARGRRRCRAASRPCSSAPTTASSTPSTRATASCSGRAAFGGKISGGATVIGDIVYFSNYGKKDTTGLGARTGRTVFHMGRGSFNPVISDGRTIFLTGYSSLYALRPKKK